MSEGLLYNNIRQQDVYGSRQGRASEPAQPAAYAWGQRSTHGKQVEPPEQTRVVHEHVAVHYRVKCLCRVNVYMPCVLAYTLQLASTRSSSREHRAAVTALTRLQRAYGHEVWVT